VHLCQICHREIKKASYLSAGAGLRLVVHDVCLQDIVEAVSEAEQRDRDRDALLRELRAVQKDITNGRD
jgi:hypothetical protein